MNARSRLRSRLPPVLFFLVAVLLAAVLWQARAIFHQRAQVDSLAQTSAALHLRLQQLGDRRARMLAEFAALQRERDAVALEKNPALAADSNLETWLGRVARLRDWLRRSPEKSIPEMRYLNSNDWLAVTLDNLLQTDAEFRLALRQLRQMAKSKPEIGRNISNALHAYAGDHDGAMPTESAQLASYLQPALPPEILSRYTVPPEVPGENDATIVNRHGARFQGMGRAILEEKFPVDPDYDSLLMIAEQGFGMYGTSAVGELIGEATRAFRAAHPGQTPTAPEQLVPFLPQPVDPTRLREYWSVRDR